MITDFFDNLKNSKIITSKLKLLNEYLTWFILNFATKNYCIVSTNELNDIICLNKSFKHCYGLYYLVGKIVDIYSLSFRCKIIVNDITLQLYYFLAPKRKLITPRQSSLAFSNEVCILINAHYVSIHVAEFLCRIYSVQRYTDCIRILRLPRFVFCSNKEQQFIWLKWLI